MVRAAVAASARAAPAPSGAAAEAAASPPAAGAVHARRRRPARSSDARRYGQSWPSTIRQEPPQTANREILRVIAPAGGLADLAQLLDVEADAVEQPVLDATAELAAVGVVQRGGQHAPVPYVPDRLHRADEVGRHLQTAGLHLGVDPLVGRLRGVTGPALRGDDQLDARAGRHGGVRR